MKKSFSLAELLIAITITILITEAAYFAGNVGRQTFNQTSEKIEINQNARVLLDRMSREIRQATEIATDLPPVSNDPENPPSTEIMFEDGHVATNRYISYKLENGQAKRSITAYYFGPSLPDPSEWVLRNARDENGNPPSSALITDEVVADKIISCQIWGESLINIHIIAGVDNQQEEFTTTVFARNL
jgi:hypothetical protein